MEFTDSILFTTTCEGKVTNLKFSSECELIGNILKSIDTVIENYHVESKEINKTQMDIVHFNCDKGIIRIPNVSDKSNEDFISDFINDFNKSDKRHLLGQIMCIGCNYGEYKTYEYIKLITPIKKSNRGRKKKDKKKTSRKRIGNGEYFNSQITITIKDPIKLDIIDFYKTNTVTSEAFIQLKSCMYHVKIYTNGKFQVPFVRDEDITTVLPVVQDVVDLVAKNEMVKIDANHTCGIEYIKSIMKNYRFSIVNTATLIDLKLLKQYFMMLKEFYESKEVDTEGVFVSGDDKIKSIEYFNENKNILLSKKITLVKFNCDNYTGLVVKVLTPIELKPNKETTLSIFDSGKINIYGANSLIESREIKEIVRLVMKLLDFKCLYSK